MIDRYSGLRRGLVGAWCPSLGATGYTLLDRSGRANHGTLTNMAGQDNWRASGSGVAINFDGTNDYVSVWDSSRVNALSGGEFSLTAWIRPTSVSATAAVCSTLTSSGGNGTFQIEIGRTSGKVTYLQTGNIVTATSSSSLVANQWSFIGFTRTGSASSWTGQLITNRTIDAFSSSEPPYPASTGVMSIGRAGGFNGQYFPGLIDDVRAWNRPLTLSEISLLASQRGIGLVPQRQRGAFPRKLSINVGGTWRPADAYLNVGGVWKLTLPYQNQGGTWK